MADERVERRLAALLAADVAGYSRLMEADELGTLQALKAHRREILDPAIAAHRGRIVKTTGDGLLAEFASAVDALTCAMKIQEQMAARNESVVAPRIGNVVFDKTYWSSAAGLLKTAETRSFAANVETSSQRPFPSLFKTSSAAGPRCHGGESSFSMRLLELDRPKSAALNTTTR